MDISIDAILFLLKDQGIQYEYQGKDDLRLAGFSDPSCYHRQTAIWLGNKNYFKPANEEQGPASVALLLCEKSYDIPDYVENTLFVEDPRNVFMLLVSVFCAEKKRMGIERTAIIAESATIGEGCYIGHHTVIGENVTIGSNTEIGHGVIVHAGTIIGERCMIEDTVVLGKSGLSLRVDSSGKLFRMPHQGRLVIGNDVDICSGSVVCCGTFKDSIIQDNAKIDSNVYIGHNVKVGKRTIIICSDINGNCEIGDNCTFLNSTVINRITIGDNVKGGVGSVVIQDIPNDTTVFGYPAKAIQKHSLSSETDPVVTKPIEKSSHDSHREANFFNLMADTLGVDPSDLSMESARDILLIWDSLNHLKLIATIEETYGVEIPLDVAMELNTMKDLYQYIT